MSETLEFVRLWSDQKK